MALTTIDNCRIMCSANPFPPYIWPEAKQKLIGQLIFMPGNIRPPEDNTVNGQVKGGKL